MRHILQQCGVTGLALWALFAVPIRSPANESAQPPLPSDGPRGGIEVQTRGPIHQAFAQPGDLAPSPGPEAPKEPPAPIPELPPERKPEGQNVQWIPGYWQWDADRKDFLWVSGVYRNVPPDRQWVAGSWTRAADGNWRFVDGFWAPAGQRERPYVPEPPASVENGPSMPPPDDNSVYTPGTWMRQDQRWMWRPGYYAAARPGQMWIGPRYVWTPAGYVFVDGYWDYPLEDRGLLFAPVFFNQPLWNDPDWSYQPSYVVDCGPLFGALFVGPYRHHYYFGDYYGPRYSRLGFQPWNVQGGRYFDPLFNYYRWNNRGNPGWYAGLQRAYAGRIAGGGPRLVTPLAQFHVAAASRSGTGIRFTGAGAGARVGGPVPGVAHGIAAAGRQLPEIRNGRPGQGLPVIHNGVARGPSGTAFRPSTVHVAHASAPAHVHTSAPAHHFSAAPSHHSGPAISHHAPSGHGGGHGGGGHGGGGHGGGGHGGGGHHR